MVPVGYCFRPTEQELIGCLEQLVRNQPLSTDQILEKKLYGENSLPWDIFNDNDNWQILEGVKEKKNGVKKFVYVVTKLSKMSAKKIKRVAGSGTWDGQTKGKPISNNRGEIIGYMKMFNFVLNAGCGREAIAAGKLNGYWILHEYYLADENLRNYVICRITRDSSKCTQVKISPALNKNQEAQEVQDSVQDSSSSCKRKSDFSLENSNASKICRDHVGEDKALAIDRAAAVSGVMTEFQNFVNSKEESPISIYDYQGWQDDAGQEENQISIYDYQDWQDDAAAQETSFTPMLNQGSQQNGGFLQDADALTRPQQLVQADHYRF